MYVTIYDPIDGTPFEVSRDKANDLILNQGWSQKPFTIEAVQVDIDEDLFTVDLSREAKRKK